MLVVSASKERADSFSMFTLRLIKEVPWLNHLIPDTLRGQRSSKISFDVGPATADHSPSVKSVGIFGQLTGSRADVIIADDVEVANNSYTQGMRDKLSEAVKEFDAILKPDTHAEIIYLGTPQTEMSLYNILQDRGYTARVWPARVPGEKFRELLGSRLAEIIAAMERPGQPTDPIRFNDRNLTEREASYGRSGFELQFMLNTTLSDREKFPLRLSDMVVMSLNPDMAPERVIWASGAENRIKDLPNLGFNGDGWYGPMAVQGEWRPYDISVMFIDPSGRGADECAWAIVKSQGANLYLASAGGHRFGYEDEGMMILQQEAKRHKVNTVYVESNFGDGMFTQLLKPWFTAAKGFSCSIEEVRSKGQKELRIIDTLEPILNQHRLIVDRKVIEKDFVDSQEKCVGSENGFVYSLFYQLTHITKDRGSLKKDDRSDALAGAIARFIAQMDSDAEVLAQLARDRDRANEIDIVLGDVPVEVFDMYLITGDARQVAEKFGGFRQPYGSRRWVETNV